MSVFVYFNNFWYQNSIDNGTIANYFRCYAIENAEYRKKYHVWLQIKDPGASMSTCVSMKPKDVMQIT